MIIDDFTLSEVQMYPGFGRWSVQNSVSNLLGLHLTPVLTGQRLVIGNYCGISIGGGKLTIHKSAQSHAIRAHFLLSEAVNIASLQFSYNFPHRWGGFVNLSSGNDSTTEQIAAYRDFYVVGTGTLVMPGQSFVGQPAVIPNKRLISIAFDQSPREGVFEISNLQIETA